MYYNRLKNIYDKNQNIILPVKPGMFLEIHEIVWEWDTKRIWKFKWLVIKVKNPNQPDGTFTIRGEAARMTIEKIYPLSFPNFDKVILLDDYKIRRSKLYYIREKIWKDARFKSIIESERRWTDLLALVKKDQKAPVVEETPVVEEKPVIEEKVEEPKAEPVEEPKIEAPAEAPAPEATEASAEVAE